MADQDSAVGKQSPTPSETDRIKPSQSSATEDPDTAAARKELRNTAISDKPDLAPSSAMASSAATDSDTATARNNTPDHDNKMKDQISSPKKKRAHDEVDQNKDSAQDANGDVSPLGADANLNRTNRSEPEKKRPRDVSSETKAAEENAASKDTKEGADKAAKTTSSSAFSSSGLSGFANTASPFLSSAGAKPLTSFASPSGSLSPFGAAAATKTDATKSVFGGSGLSNGASPFSQPSGSKASVFGSGSGLSGGFAGLGGSKLGTFGKPGETFKSSKPSKPFGAPESDAESDSGEADDGDDNAGDEDKEEKEVDDDKKKVKLQKTNVDDGEAGEVTVLQLRARIYFLDKSTTTAAWKERGAGNLKINVPEACVDLDDNNVPIPGSFDASTLEDAENKNVRLIMRQDSTHRLLLNTVLIPAMSFQEKPTNKTVCVLFTAIEDKGEPVSIQLKFNPANAKNFLNEVGKIQRELQSN
ncbi:dead deah box protein [Apiospora arundinis]|uniref:Dead deah box protein n=1 Tax=Apiospora arundinis TaxID=335852 RepID=A0ABR2IUN3_9PEZI